MKNLITSSNLTFTKKNCNCGIISKDIKLYTKTKLTRKSHKSKRKSHKSKINKKRN
jgi:hypothetical protein